MGIELELAVLLAIVILGSSGFAVFEIETPWWRKVLKWSIVTGGTLALYRAAGHWALALPIARTHSTVSALFVTKNAYPREALLEAVLRFIEEDIELP